MIAEQIAAQLATISERLARIETKVDSMTSKIGDHEFRIRSLERARWISIGLAATAGGTFGELARVLLKGHI